MNTFCPQCGFGVKIDEDGCCIHCGSSATGDAVDSLFNDLADQLPNDDTFQPAKGVDMEIPERRFVQLEEIEESYYELIMAVENKHPNESRHQTALRLIREAQQPSNQAQEDVEYRHPDRLDW